MEYILEENAKFLELAQRFYVNYVLVQDHYEINVDLQ